MTDCQWLQQLHTYGLLRDSFRPNTDITELRAMVGYYQPEQAKQWVVISPPGSSGVTLLLARASKPEQEQFVGNQSGGRVFLFLNSDDFFARLQRYEIQRNKLRERAKKAGIWNGGDI